MAHIRTYARLKPSADPYDEYDITNNCLQIRVPEVYRDYGSSPGKLRSNICYEFRYDNVFNIQASQEDVFNAVAYDIIEGFLNGYNGTIFAYGQTGTGKTYTVEGSARKYSERGLAPRALSMIYQALAQRQDEELTAHISYIEIYQEVAYDLLTAGARTLSPVTPFPKVNVVEGPGGTCLIRNLSVHLAPSEDVAQSLLLQGQANRKVAETPVNQRSSRSHAVLTMYLAAKKPDSDVILRSKLHLVDLAGSERVAKTGVDGHQLTEAKSINLSLHHLETVIISLQTDALASTRLQHRTAQSLRSLSSSALSHCQTPNNDGFKSTRHIPYRNSLLTMVLRDSLGGNCNTAMIATLSLEWRNLGETLSTCRFAQRVACIANHAIRNEEIDDQTLIRRLKKRIAELESEISFLRLSQEESSSDPAMAGKLTDEDKLFCARVVHEYLGGRLNDPITAGITSPYKFRECLKVLKKMVLKGYFNPQSVPAPVTDRKNDSAVICNGRDVQILKLDGNNNSSDLGEVNTNGTPPKPVQAWDDTDTVQQQNLNLTFTVNSGQTYRPSGSRDPVTSRGRSPKREPYKSPFERQREKEIHRLSKKLSLMENARLSKQNKLAHLKHQVALQELETVETGIQAKLDVTADQVSDQRAYVLQLRHTEARPDLLGQEELVEMQLKKRQAKFEKKLEEIRKQRNMILSESCDDETGEEPKSPSRQRVEDKFAQCKKRDGSLNTRQVFEMLKSEAKKQSKVQAQIEREHIMTKSRQLEIKEAATRLKLRELKEMFQRSKIDDSSRPAYNGISSAVPYSEANGDCPGTSGSHRADRDPNTGYYSGLTTRRLDKALSSVNEESGVGYRSDSNEPPRAALGVSTFSGGTKLVDSRFHVQSKSDNSLSSKWDSAYSTISRPDTAETSTSRQNGHSSHTSSQNCDGPEYVSDHLGPTNGSGCDLQVLDLDHTDDGQTPQDSTGSKSRPTQPTETLIPSQYVHAMRAEDVFDGRRMALTSTTFDGALSTMLDETDRQLVYDNFSPQYYDQFARPGRSRRPTQKSHANRKSTRSAAHTDDTNLDDTMKLIMSRGLDNSNSPISAKLSKFLNSSGDHERSPHSSPTGKKNRSKASKTCSDPFQSKLDEFNKSGFSEDGSDVQPRITALKEADRERVYMTKAQVEKERVQKIRRARRAAEVIQRAWRRRQRKQ